MFSPGKARNTASTPLVNRKSGSSEKCNQLIPLKRPDISTENLHSSSSASKQCVEFNESESNTIIEKKRKKVRFVEAVAIESEKVEVHLEPVGMKRKRMSGHGFKAQFKAMCSKEIVLAKSPGSQLEKLPSHEEPEEQVQAVNPKKFCLKMNEISPQDSQTTIDSGRDQLLTEEDINPITSNVDEERLHPSPLELEIVKNNIVKGPVKEEDYENPILSKQNQVVKDKGAGNEIHKDSARKELFEEHLSQKKQAVKYNDAGNEIQKVSCKEEHCENKILSQKKQAMKDKGAGNVVEKHSGQEECCEIVSLIKKIQINCDRRIKKLAKKQQHEIQEFHRIWEEKRSVLVMDHKVEAALIRYIHREDSARMVDKLKLLNGEFAKKMKGFNRLKEKKLKDLEANQLAARNEESEKEASWLASAEACRSIVGVPGEIQLLEPDKEVPPEMPDTAPNDIDYTNPLQLKDYSFDRGFHKMDGTGVPGSMVSQRDETDEITTIQPVEMNKEVPLEMTETAPNASVECADKRIDDGDGIGLPDALVNQGEETDDSTTGGIPLVEQILEPSEPQVPEDQVQQRSTCVVIQDQDAWVLEKQNTSSFQVDASEDIGNVTSQSIVELRDKNPPVVQHQVTSQIEVANLELVGYVSPVQDRSAQVVEKQITSPFDVPASDHIDTITISLSDVEVQDQEPVVEEQVALQIEVENSDPVDTVDAVPSDDALPVGNGDELHIGCRDASPICNQATSVEFESQIHNLERNSSQIDQIEETEVVPQESASRSGSDQELHHDIGSESRIAHEISNEPSTSSQSNVAMSHQAGLQSGSLDHLYGPSYFFSDHIHQVASCESQPLFSEPLQNEMNRILKETEQIQKKHEKVVAQLKADHEKEIQEIIAEINRKYELKLGNAQAEFVLKKNELDKNRNKVLRSKLLAELLGSTCLGFWSFGLPGMQKGLGEVIEHPPTRNNPSGSMQHVPMQHLMRAPPVSPIPVQRSPGPLIATPNFLTRQQLLRPHSMGRVHTMQLAPPPCLTSTSRPPVISAITPTHTNRRFGGEIRFTPPLLRPRGSGPPSSRPTVTFPVVTQHRPATPAFQTRPQLQGAPAGPQNPSSLSALELLMDIDHRAHTPTNHTFRSLEQTCWADGIIHGNLTSSGVPTDTICLSDED